MVDGVVKSKVKAFANIVNRAVQAPCESSVQLLRWSADKNRAFPRLLKNTVKTLVALGVGFLVYTVFPKDGPPPEWWNGSPELFAKLLVGVISTTASFVSVIAVGAILPLIFFVPDAVALRQMGLRAASVNPSGMIKALEKFLRWHDDSQRVRMICISGRTLLRSLDGSPKAPLSEYVAKGMISAIMPTSDREHPTLKGRFGTYNSEFRLNNYQTIDHLIAEIDHSKSVLRRNAGNEIFEHSIICMWRVVLLSNHCLVQTYFPNHDGGMSDRAPVFVFEKEPDCKYSYYETFENMFTLVSESSSRVHPSP